MKVITVANEKGGVGKTLLAVHVAAGLALRGQRVLLVDTDAQGHATISLGLAKYPGLYDWLVRGVEPGRVLARIHPGVYGCAGDAPGLTPQEQAEMDLDAQAVELQRRGLAASRLHVIGSNVETYTIASAISDELLFQRRLAELADDYDYAIVDTAPTPSLLHSSIYLATQYILYPTECEFLSADGLEESLGRLRGARRRRGQEIHVAGIIPNKYRESTLEHREILASLRAHFGAAIWPPVPLAIVWAETATYGLPVFVHAPTSEATLALWEILDRVEGATNGKQAS